ncbi:MAG: glycosyltransferase [Deltaproteobacteria bacterium]|nr:glycosyltransferase [Deltaproteobacteria bacterium]
MKILHIGKYYPPFSGGIENFLQDLLSSHVKSGLEVAVVAHNHDSCITKTTIETYESVLVYRVPCHGTLLYAPVSPLFPFVLNNVINEFKPDIIHLHMPNTSAFWLFFTPTQKKIPLIVHWHSDVVLSGIDTRLKYAYPLYRPFEQALLKRSSAVIVTSQPYLKTSTALENWAHKTTVIPLGINNQRVYIPENIKEWAETIWGENESRFLIVGRLTYYKGHERFIRAIPKIPGVRVIIVGKGELMNPLKKIITQYAIEKQVSLIGYLEEEKLEALLSSAHCLVLPSIERTEAFGVVLLEAMRAGKPSIIFNVKGSGTSWVVKDGITGLNVPLDSESKLIKAVNMIATKPEIRERMGKNAKERFKTKFHIHQVADSVVKLYKKFSDTDFRLK